MGDECPLEKLGGIGMNANEIKSILAEKFADEGCGFKKSDIKVNRRGNKTTIIIKDYEHNPFEIDAEEDDYFGYCLWIKDICDEEIIGMYDSKREYPWKEALLNLGYYIASRF